MTKEIVIKLRVPKWIDEEKIRERVQKVTRKLIASVEQSADEARKFFEVKEIKEEIEIPENLEEKLLKLRRKQTW
ncbi:MAG: hypothetical protein QW272_08975 [Candidatus Methanomethylicaceae archaeon]